MLEQLLHVASWANAWPGTPLLFLTALALALAALDRPGASVAAGGVLLCLAVLPADPASLRVLGVALGAVLAGHLAAWALRARLAHMPVGRSAAVAGLGLVALAWSWKAGSVSLPSSGSFVSWVVAWPGSGLLFGCSLAAFSMAGDRAGRHPAGLVAHAFGAGVLICSGVVLAHEGQVRILEASAVGAVLLGTLGAVGVGEAGRRSVAAVALMAAVSVLWSGGVRDRWGAGAYVHPAGVARSATAARVEILARGLSLASSVAVSPDGRVFFAEFTTGRIGVLTPGDRGWRKDTFAKVVLPDAASLELQSTESGLWGLTVDEPGDWLYVMAAATIEASDGGVRGTSSVLRYPLSGGEPEVVVDGLPAGAIHNGGALAFAPDGRLWVTVGDGGDASSVGPGSLAGTIVAVEPGSGDAPAVVAGGFRNVYGLDFRPGSGRAWATENGSWCCDRLLRVDAGRDHGWPRYGDDIADVGVMASDPTVVAPVFDSGTSRLGPTGLVFVREAYGQPEGTLLFGTWHTSAIHRVRLDDLGRVEAHDIVLDAGSARAPDGSVYPFAGGFSAFARGPAGQIYFATLDSVGRVVTLPEAAR